MVLRWAGAAWLETEKHFRKIMGYRDLWMLEAALKELAQLAEKSPSALDKGWAAA